MKKKDVVKLNKILINLKEIGDTNFKYFIIKNLNLIKNILDPLLELEEENSKILLNFKEEKNNLISKIGKKEENKIFIDLKDEEMVSEFKIKFEKIIEKYKSDLEKYDTIMEEYELLLEEKIDEILNFRVISIEACPKEGISFEDIEFLIYHSIIK